MLCLHLIDASKLQIDFRVVFNANAPLMLQPMSRRAKVIDCCKKSDGKIQLLCI